MLVRNIFDARVIVVWMIAFGGVLGLCGCGDSASSTPVVQSEPARVRVFAPNTPLAWLVRELGGEGIDLLAPWYVGGVDPAEWSPSAADIRKLQSADLVIFNGADYEPWASRVALRRSTILDSTAELTKFLIKQDGAVHTHGPKGAHSHTGFASSTWLSPTLFAAQASAIAERLATLQPSRRAAILERLAGITDRLTTLDASLKECGLRQPQWLASHPVYQYVGQSARATIDSMHWEPRDSPSDAQWAEFSLARAKIGSARVPMLWEGEPTVEVRKRLETMGVDIVRYPLYASMSNDAIQDLANSIREVREALNLRPYVKR